MSVVIIGGGHNGLAAAYYLAKAGLAPVVLEQRESVGGGAITDEIHPGFRCPTLTHDTHLHAAIAHDMNLARRGVQRLVSPVDVFAPALNGPPIVLSRDSGITTESLDKHNARDAEAFRRYVATIERIAGALASTLAAPPPDIDRPGIAEIGRAHV